ncbi:helix-turn-helix transcriptional regulator [Gloeobacter morelensis]|uniref:LuxR family transcriptional regulator n=1 Tax=Gloeobacter morelensis MG652769 TaxID=2781736 RepID=A0ABY3PGK1_9CYAN|nr:LuxR C-terminal-related transcriptional regulator [Gloeobacter morelensis]UFP92788.1 LuxR family transcriptional regulator [Gloeobacter morelensis MG652769]
MTRTLRTWIDHLAAAESARELRLRYMDTAGRYFASQHWSIYLMQPAGRLADFDVCGLPDAFVDHYEAVGRAVDPVLGCVLDTHAPAHEQLILSAQGWKQSRLYRDCCAIYDHEHIMTGPIVGGGRLIGTVHFARTGTTPAYGPQDLRDLGALCAHLSACLASLRSQPDFHGYRAWQQLTPRERQIAALLCEGLTNARIGERLWISENTVKRALGRVYQKLGVSSRAHLVARLSTLS